MLWDLFSISSLNVPGDDASLALAAVVVKTGLLGDAGAADIGVPALTLGELHGAAAARLLGKLGATVRLQTKVAAIEPKDGEFIVRLGHGVPTQADDGESREPALPIATATPMASDDHRRRRRGARGAARAGRAADPGTARCPPRRSTAGPASAPPRS